MSVTGSPPIVTPPEIAWAQSSGVAPTEALLISTLIVVAVSWMAGTPTRLAPLRCAEIAVHERVSVGAAGLTIARASVPLASVNPVPLTPRKTLLTPRLIVVSLAPTRSALPLPSVSTETLDCEKAKVTVPLTRSNRLTVALPLAWSRSPVKANV